MATPFSLDFQPGLQRDGTQFDSNSCLDAEWCRWRLSRPRKMGGRQRITDALNGLPRRIHCFYENGLVYAHVGTTNGIQQVIFTSAGVLVAVNDRTPSTFAGGSAVGFTFDAIFDTTSGATQLIAHAAPDAQDASSTLKSLPFIGVIDQPTALQAFTPPPDLMGGTYTAPAVAGGVFCSQPFVFAFDTQGLLQWSAPNLPLTLGVTGGTSGAGQARISAQKLVAGMALRGGGAQSPAAVIWSLSEVISATFIGSTAEWAFNTISPSSSILGTDCVIEYDGLYFWAGVDRFLVFNGTVTEVPNKFNQDFFFDNLTPGYEASTFATKIPRYGEVWWCACLFGSAVPNWAIIYNVRENVWYDTPLPNGGRSAGYFAQGFNRPIFGGVVSDGAGYKLWIHEIGVDEVDGTQLNAIRSYFETPMIGGPKNSPADNRGLSIESFEPDLQQTGDLEVYLIGQSNVRSPSSAGDTITLPLVPATTQEAFASFRDRTTNRLRRVHVEANSLGASYICGKNLLHGEVSDARLFD